MTSLPENGPDLTCIESQHDNGCQGVVELRESLSGTGVSIPRCDYHWSLRLDLQQALRERYPENPPSDWSPYDAGEAWGEDDY